MATTTDTAPQTPASTPRRGASISREEYEALRPGAREVTTTSENGKILTADEYFKVVQKPDTRAAFWKWADVKHTMEELGKDPLREAERRFCTTVNSDCGELVGASPFIFIGWQLIHPGEQVPPHRHNSVAIYHILEGRGHTVVQEAGGEWTKFQWEKGDTLACPAFAYHAHYVDEDAKDDVFMYVVQDMPMLAAGRMLFWEEPMGQENIRHMVSGASASWSVTREAPPKTSGTPEPSAT